jgi:EAL domain-containing protein (putative c-di-GMP-specific phosphodiesterase class I)
LTRTLGITTTAEGIETLEQFRKLTEAGVDAAQGYLLDRPIPAANLDFSRVYGDRLVENAASVLSSKSPAAPRQIA